MAAQLATTTLAQTGGSISTRVQLVAVIVAIVLLAFVLELVRRRQLVERYALIWMMATLALVVLAIWRGLLGELADLLGIASPVNALFLVALGVTFLLLLHFSVVSSRLSEETKILAQELARVQQELRAARGNTPAQNGDATGEPESEPQSDFTPTPTE